MSERTAEDQTIPRRWALTGPRAWLVTVALAAAAAAGLASLPDYVLPAPGAILNVLIDDRRMLLSNLAPTAQQAGLGFLIGNGAAIALAILLVHVPSLLRPLMSLAVLVRGLPIIAITPLLTVWLGLGMAPKIAAVTLMVFFPTLIVSLRALSSVDRAHLDVMAVYGASTRDVLLRLRLPSALPYILESLKVAAPTAVLGALVAEWLGAREGLGHVMAIAAYEFRTDVLWATLLTSSALSLAAYWLVGLIASRAVAWEAGERG